MPENDVSEICRFARMIEYRRGEAAVCLKGLSEKKLLLFLNFPNRLSSAPNCVATTMYSTGHSMPDSYVKIEKIKECDKRELPKKKKKESVSGR